jgi:isocitrate dehydrogenase
MLNHIGQQEVATRVHNAWLRTIEEGIHTGDIFKEGSSRQRANTADFTAALIARLGQKPEILKPVDYKPERPHVEHDDRPRTAPPRSKKDLVGVDVFVDWTGSVEDLAAKVLKATDGILKLILITNRGVKVWPAGAPETFKVDHWRLRFRTGDKEKPLVSHRTIIQLLGAFEKAGIDFIKTEHLCNFDGKPGYSLGQGE